MTNNFDCVIIGAGPGGYVAAITAAQSGLKTALIEELQAGGTCLNRGCVPSKALLISAGIVSQIKHAKQFGVNIESYSIDFPAMVQRKNTIVQGIRQGLEGLIRSNKITTLQGRGSLISSTEVKVIGKDDTIVKTEKIILATGSEPRPFPGVPFSSRVLCSTGILNLTTLPNKLAIIGGGVIGCEFASLFHTLGVEITIIEALDHILALNNPDISKTIAETFTKQGIRILTKTMISRLEELEHSVEIEINGQTEQFETVLVAIGRQFNTKNIGLDNAGVIYNEHGIIPVDERMRTNVPNIYAIGDITGKQLLAHVASHQGIIAGKNVANHEILMDYSAVPSVIFTFPEVAMVGLSPLEAEQQNISTKITKFPFKAIGKAVAMGETHGFAVIISEKNTQQILGAYVIGPHAASLIGEMSLAVRNELTLPCIYETIHAHPTLSEIWVEGALLATNHPLHIPPKS
ncbi:dihydrolipoyl dehydrogenase [Candidatus Chlamydia sanziniae]|uniref:Dihydrolipoyl dehydrogenase n=1 Tax=Candidatus Chlamydia sanziniae TaxID=1806891 RepID=A0A1A9HUF3_9CHLA|nr:dihydrolipoyl dehydrogenase [Candidatus Chlamydia sanziniae]ANH78630.1 Dihydrolipoamide dehydrogenase of pyruvate dehydrogenase complex [Candidatus Chlamydia sanziniae]